MVVDPLKALDTVTNVTVMELRHFFFSPDVRTEYSTLLTPCPSAPPPSYSSRCTRGSGP